MANVTPAPSTEPLGRETVSYTDVRVVITPEGPYHYEVSVGERDGTCTEHAVEYVAVNATTIHFEEPIWFADANLDVGVPIGQAGDTVWVWP